MQPQALARGVRPPAGPRAARGRHSIAAVSLDRPQLHDKRKNSIGRGAINYRVPVDAVLCQLSSVEVVVGRLLLNDSERNQLTQKVAAAITIFNHSLVK